MYLISDFNFPTYFAAASLRLCPALFHPCCHLCVLLTGSMCCSRSMSAIQNVAVWWFNQDFPPSPVTIPGIVSCTHSVKNPFKLFLLWCLMMRQNQAPAVTQIYYYYYYFICPVPKRKASDICISAIFNKRKHAHN